jgi:hypothetical protein
MSPDDWIAPARTEAEQPSFLAYFIPCFKESLSDTGVSEVKRGQLKRIVEVVDPRQLQPLLIQGRETPLFVQEL